MWARVDENNYIQELTDIDPAGRYHPDLIWRTLPAGAERFVNGAFKLLADGTVDTPVDVFLLTTKQRLAGFRWVKECNGITLSSGFEVWTGRDSMSSLLTTKAAFDSNTIQGVSWKGKTEWRVLNKTEFETMLSEITVHVGKCFSAEKQIADTLGTFTTPEQFFNYNILDSFEAAYNNL